jgi:predicted enzyme related to lactoylglutathione lyase
VEADMPKNAVAHFEIYADDPGKLAQFYTQLFDWEVERVPGMDYQFIKTVATGDKGPTQVGGINGGMITRPEGYKPNAWVNYVNVDSVDQAVERAKALGAQLTRPKMPVPGMGWFAMLIDPQGNSFAVWQQDPAAK